MVMKRASMTALTSVSPGAGVFPRVASLTSVVL
jgi:hypothetical protein